MARILFKAFGRFHTHHNFSPDFPDLAFAQALVDGAIGDPSTYGVVAVLDGRIVGSNFLSERDPIGGIGPISVDPDIENNGIGRKLMHAVISRGAGASGIRLLQDAFNTKSMGLYASLGFCTREPLAVMTGRPRDMPAAGSTVRPMTRTDLPEVEELGRRVHGFPRSGDVEAALLRGTPLVLEGGSRIRAYMTMPGLWLLNHAVAETEADMMALVLGAGASSSDPIGFLVPTRSARFFRWCLGQGMRIVKPMTLMTRGEYNEPQGAWMPSVLY
ncbi:GNAT family N-acetyltransferase [Roseibium sp. M-1]